jgi:hypothetical protein
MVDGAVLAADEHLQATIGVVADGRVAGQLASQ